MMPRCKRPLRKPGSAGLSMGPGPGSDEVWIGMQSSRVWDWDWVWVWDAGVLVNRFLGC